MKGTALPDQTSQALRPSKTWNDAELYFRQSEPGCCTGNPQRTRHGELAAAAEREAVDCGDDWLAKRLDKVHHRLPLAAVRFCRERREDSQFRDVCTGHKGLLAGARHDHPTDPVVGTGHPDGGIDLRKRGMTQRVHRARPIDGQDRNAVRLFIENVFEGRHSSAPSCDMRTAGRRGQASNRVAPHVDRSTGRPFAWLLAASFKRWSRVTQTH